MSGFALHPQAYEDIHEIRVHIAEDSPDAADWAVNEILERFRHLAQFPDQGFRRRNYTTLPLRFLAVRDYLIVYAPDKNPLWIVARSPRVIAAILKGRE